MIIIEKALEINYCSNLQVYTYYCQEYLKRWINKQIYITNDLFGTFEAHVSIMIEDRDQKNECRKTIQDRKEENREECLYIMIVEEQCAQTQLLEWSSNSQCVNTQLTKYKHDCDNTPIPIPLFIYYHKHFDFAIQNTL